MLMFLSRLCVPSTVFNVWTKHQHQRAAQPSPPSQTCCPGRELRVLHPRPTKNYSQEFPGGPVAKTLHSQCSGRRFDPCLGN